MAKTKSASELVQPMRVVARSVQTPDGVDVSRDKIIEGAEFEPDLLAHYIEEGYLVPVEVAAPESAQE